jgi:hypothetical protein
MALAEADFDYKDFDDRNAADRSVHTRFFLNPVKDEAASAEAGRPIYADREYVEIRASGNSTNIVCRPVTDMDRQRFHRQYMLFKSGHAEQVVGTRLSEVPWITRGQVEELTYLKILTVEQLSAVNDQFCTTIPGIYELRRKAQMFLESAVSSAPITALQKENEELKSQIADLMEAVKAQATDLQKLQARKEK